MADPTPDQDDRADLSRSAGSSVAEPLKRLGGEFVIIVLGVLVALAVDDFRTRLDESRMEQYYLDALRADLLADVDALEGSLAQLDTLEVLGHRFSAALGDSMQWRLNPDVSHISVEWATVPSMLSRLRGVEPSRSTYNELVASGHLRLLKSDRLRSGLTSYYLGFERMNVREDEWADPLTEGWYGKLREKGLLIIDLRNDSSRVSRLRGDGEARALIRAMGLGRGYLRGQRLELIEEGRSIVSSIEGGR